MSLILNIDTATEVARIGLAKDGKTLQTAENREQKDHASWLHPAIEKLLETAGSRLSDLQAIAVVSGPGSYTGLRVGMAAAKGFCYALGLPLITEDKLRIMASAASEQLPDADLLCPMLDARRMEVFTAVYQKDLSVLLPSTAMVMEQNPFTEYLTTRRMSFFGSGADKCKPIISSPNARFVLVKDHAGYLGNLSFLRYLRKEFTGLAYSEPVYTKEFYTHTRK